MNYLIEAASISNIQAGFVPLINVKQPFPLTLFGWVSISFPLSTGGRSIRPQPYSMVPIRVRI